MLWPLPSRSPMNEFMSSIQEDHKISNIEPRGAIHLPKRRHKELKCDKKSMPLKIITYYRMKSNNATGKKYIMRVDFIWSTILRYTKEVPASTCIPRRTIPPTPHTIIRLHKNQQLLTVDTHMCPAHATTPTRWGPHDFKYQIHHISQKLNSKKKIWTGNKVLQGKEDFFLLLRKIERAPVVKFVFILRYLLFLNSICIMNQPTGVTSAVVICDRKIFLSWNSL